VRLVDSSAGVSVPQALSNAIAANTGRTRQEKLETARWFVKTAFDSMPE
jgi:hypothetical protein